MAPATPLRSGDQLARLAAASEIERVAAQCALADLPLREFLSTAVMPCESCEVTRLIVDGHDAAAFATGCCRTRPASGVVRPGGGSHTPEMAAKVSKFCRIQNPDHHRPRVMY